MNTRAVGDVDRDLRKARDAFARALRGNDLPDAQVQYNRLDELLEERFKLRKITRGNDG